ncbi:uncharacterized protein EDB91DRAFT_1241708 [Suillus paluster]|uniref:uncharacterized protein n=1 Tax=Suillus paluster TaxID=48578 RepID=UPI001B86C937|nr:uncharacterized protein EDB91DRAFT_1241708 [Suillus paluster]KAG1756663.1 hypothetical protein EDB91DRAFT_1241708 [Suillus paluster]
MKEVEVLELRAQQDGCVSANRKDEKKVFNAICRAVQFFSLKLDDKHSKKRCKIYQTWLYNHTKTKQRRDKIKYGKKWTARIVVTHYKRKEVLQRIKDETSLKPGDPDMFKYYQGMVTQVVEEMPTDELEKAKETAEEWSNNFLPPKIQATVATKKGPHYITHDEKGAVLYDFNDKFGGDSFTKTKEWSDILPVWQEYAKEQFGVDAAKGGGVHNVGFRTNARKPAFELKADGDGMPLLPDTTKERLKQKKAIMRAFLTEHYRHCSGNAKAVVPWRAIMECQDDFISRLYLPDDVHVKDPSKLQMSKATTLPGFWYDQQENGVPLAFKFKAWKNGWGEMVNLIETTRAPAPGWRILRLRPSDPESSNDQSIWKASLGRESVRLPIHETPPSTEDDEITPVIHHKCAVSSRSMAVARHCAITLKSDVEEPKLGSSDIEDTPNAPVPKERRFHEITAAVVPASLSGEDIEVHENGVKQAGIKRRAMGGQLTSPCATKHSHGGDVTKASRRTTRNKTVAEKTEELPGWVTQLKGSTRSTAA